MAYESPISVWWSDTKIEQLRDEYDNLIVRAVKNVCPQVDKDELIKALEYDRGQYEKGFADGLTFNPPVKSRGDAIRAMSDEELAEFLLNRDLDVVEKSSKAVGFTYKVDREPCLANVIDWLKQEVKEDSKT